MNEMYCPGCRAYFWGEGCPPYSVMEKRVGDEWVHVHPLTGEQLFPVDADPVGGIGE